MNTSSKCIYLSAVSEEFKSYKSELAHSLTRKGFLVKRREDFEAADNLLEKLEETIRQSDVVICLVGNQFGDEPDTAHAEEFKDISKKRHSYAQWEYLFGSHVAKSVHVFCPASVSETTEAKDLTSLQAGFRASWIESGNGEPTEFDSHATLVEEVLVIPELTPKAEGPEIARALNLENPYVGLRKFTEADADKFFGRKAITEQIVKTVGSTPLLTIFGHSGSGKSSVILAGVIPRFRKEFPTGKVITFSPDKNPFHSLGGAMQRAGLPIDLALDACQASSRKFTEIHAANGNPAEPWLIFIDQFEEIFTRAEKSDAPIVFQFVQSLIDLAGTANTQVRVILAVRDEFLGRLGEFRGLTEITDKHLIRLTPPTRGELREMIEIPAAVHGVRFEAGLVDRITSHVEGCPQRLPLMQYALAQLWNTEKADKSQFAKGMVVDEEVTQMGGLQDRKINRASYDSIHTIEGALANRMESLFAGRPAAEKRRIRDLMLSFITLSNSAPCPAPVSHGELQKSVGVGCNALINEMVKEQILVETDYSVEEHVVYQLTHESLINSWPEFNRWVNEIHSAAQMRIELATDARLWVEKTKAGTNTFEDLWGGAKLDTALEFSKPAVGSKLSHFERAGGLGETEQRFLNACGDRFIQESKQQLIKSATNWKKSKKKDLLLRGLELHQALEQQSDFESTGGLDKLTKKFLTVSEKNSHPKKTGLRVALTTAVCVALIGMLTPLGGMALLPEDVAEAIKETVAKYLPGK